MRKFFVSIGCVPDYVKNPEAIGNVIIRLEKNKYLHIPVSEHDFDSKEKFAKKMSEMAEDMWEYMGKYEEDIGEE